MKFLLATITLGIVFAMNRFHEDYFKDANNLFEEIGYKNSTEVFKIDQKIRNFVKVFQERRKNRIRSLNEIECTKTFSTKTHTRILAFLSFRKIGQIMDDWIIDDSQKLLILELRLTLKKNWRNIKYAITYSPYPMPHHEPQKHKLDVEIRFALRNTKEDKTDNSLMITKDEQNWKLTGKGFINTLYVLIIIFIFNFRFNVIIDFHSHFSFPLSLPFPFPFLYVFAFR